jgi:hypothetical protein
VHHSTRVPSAARAMTRKSTLVTSATRLALGRNIEVLEDAKPLHDEARRSPGFARERVRPLSYGGFNENHGLGTSGQLHRSARAPVLGSGQGRVASATSPTSWRNWTCLPAPQRLPTRPNTGYSRAVSRAGAWPASGGFPRRCAATPLRSRSVRCWPLLHARAQAWRALGPPWVWAARRCG